MKSTLILNSEGCHLKKKEKNELVSDWLYLTEADVPAIRNCEVVSDWLYFIEIGRPAIRKSELISNWLYLNELEQMPAKKYSESVSA